MLTIDMDWKDELARLNRLVWQAHNSIMDHHMELAPAVDAIRSFVIPSMETGLQILPLSSKVVKKLDQWSSLLRSAALHSVKSARNISSSGFGTLTSIPDLVLLARACLLYTSPSPRDGLLSRMPSSA